MTPDQFKPFLEAQGVIFEPRQYGLCSTKTITLQALVNAHNKAIILEGSGELERIIAAIKKHDAENKDHGVGCSCMDEHAGALRRLFDQQGMYIKTGPFADGSGTHYGRSKSLSNLLTIFHYLTR